MPDNADGSVGRTGSRDHAGARRLAVLTMVAGAAYVLASPAANATGFIEVVSVTIIALGTAMLLYVIPRMHAYQAPDDGRAGRWSARLVPIGAAVAALFIAIDTIWGIVGNDSPGWLSTVWVIGILLFLIGLVLFGIGSLAAKRFSPTASLLVTLGLPLAFVIDVVRGTVLGSDGSLLGWYIGVPLFGIGLVWMGYSLWSRPGGRRKRRSSTGVKNRAGRRRGEGRARENR